MRLSVGSAVALSVALMAAGCLGGGGGGQTTTETVRATIVTAPADLQLVCASEAVTRFSSDPNQTLPTSSAQTEPGRYQVELTLGTGSATCVIDDNATVISLVQA
ncbi:MAG: hypothetical protein AAGF49_06690 [Pseudomonadota bacterium]